MSSLEEFYKLLDENSWAYHEVHDINKALREIYDRILTEEEKEKYRILFKLESETFQFIKNPEKQISGNTSWKRTNEDGTEETIGLPNINEWQGEDFNYIKERFSTAKNLFARCEYGLILFYRGKLSNNESIILFELLFELSKFYYNDALKGGDRNYNSIYFYTTLKNAAHVAFFKKNAPEFTDQLERIIRFTNEVHSNWSKVPDRILRIVLDLTEIMIKYFDEFKKYVNPKDFFDCNCLAAKEIEKSYLHGAIYVVDENIKLALRIGESKESLIRYKAELNEKLYEEAKETRFLAALHFLEIALKLYGDINDLKKVSELQKLYQEKRTEIELGTIRQELDKSESERLGNLILNEVKSKDENGIIISLITGSMFSTLEAIREMAEHSKKEHPFLFHAGPSVIDKYGNTIAVYSSEKDKEYYSFIESYGFQFQLGAQLLSQFFMEALNAKKISFESVKKWVDESWLGEREQRVFTAHINDFSLSDTIYPGIRLMFDQLAAWKETNVQPDFICVVDSLCLKVEKILREFCFKIGIPIFIETKEKGGHILKNEKNIDQLLSDLEATSEGKANFSEEDRFFIKFIMTEKSGQNLRHRIAHGLMDVDEYHLLPALLCLTIILKLSAYKFHTP